LNLFLLYNDQFLLNVALIVTCWNWNRYEFSNARDYYTPAPWPLCIPVLPGCHWTRARPVAWPGQWDRSVHDCSPWWQPPSAARGKFI